MRILCCRGEKVDVSEARWPKESPTATSWIHTSTNTKRDINTDKQTSTNTDTDRNTDTDTSTNTNIDTNTDKHTSINTNTDKLQIHPQIHKYR